MAPDALTLPEMGETFVLDKSKRLTDREMEVLKSLTHEWVRPMDIGGRDSSDHSRVLASLVKKGRAEKKGVSSYKYRHAELGALADALNLGLQYANLYSPPDDIEDDGSAARDRNTIRTAIAKLGYVSYVNCRF